jgi:hypothetical protein
LPPDTATARSPQQAVSVTTTAKQIARARQRLRALDAEQAA